MNSLKNCSDALNAAIRKGIAMPVKTASLLSFVTVAILLYSCGPSKAEMEYRENAKMMEDSVTSYIGGLATDTIDGVTHNFIRYGNLKCKVQDVLTATKLIEDLVSENGGYSSNSELTSHINYQSAVNFKKDSVIEQLHYNTVSTLKLRIPAKQLDTVLRKITGLAMFVDYRALKSDDVKMKLFANALTETRLQNYKKRVEKKIDTRQETKLNHVIAAEENILNKQASADNTRLESFGLAEQVNYSTLVVELYGPQKISIEKAAIAVAVEPYEPPFTEKFGQAFLKGFDLLKKFILLITQSWGIIFIIVLIIFSGKKMAGLYNRKFAEGSK